MTMPTTTVEIAFTTSGGNPVWTDVTPWVEWQDRVVIARRRSHELDEVQPGTLSLTLLNDDGRFTAGNTASPYYPNVRINRPIRVRATWQSITYTRYVGFVDRWPHAWSRGVLGYAAITATDRMKLLQRQLLGATALPATQLSGARAATLLSAAGVTTSAVDPGLSDLGLSGNEATQNLLQLLRTTATSEAGLFFIARDGTPTFQDRGRRQRPSSTVLTVSADQCGADLAFLVDDALLINEATVITHNGNASTQTDPISENDYGTYSARLESMLTSTAEAADRARYLLSKYSEPVPRAGQISIEARTQPTLWPALLGSEIGQRIQITNLPPSAPTGTLDLWLEGIQDEITDESWIFTLDPSPAAATISMILDHSTYGRLDNNRLGW